MSGRFFIKTLQPLTDGSLPYEVLLLLKQFFLPEQGECRFVRFQERVTHIEVLDVLRYPEGLFWLLPYSRVRCFLEQLIKTFCLSWQSDFRFNGI